jgi:hypothetical protein
VIWLSLLTLALGVVVGLAHVTEWALERRIARLYPSLPLLTPRPSRKRSRRWSAPPRPSLSDAQHPHSSPALLQGSLIAKYGAFEERRPSSTTTNVAANPVSRPNGQGSGEGGATPGGLTIDVEVKEDSCEGTNAAIERSRLILGVAYGGASGTLSGLCLLFAKTGIELCILTVVGQNQVSLSVKAKGTVLTNASRIVWTS